MIEARFDKVVIRPKKAKEITDGGIILPDVAQLTRGEGEVLGVGPQATVKIGDIALYSVYAGQEVEDEGETLLVIPDNQIYGVRSSRTQTA